jgi:hypothetical protein
MPSISVRAVGTRPSQFASQESILNEAKGVLNQAMSVMENDYKRTFKTWHHKPKVVKRRTAANEAEVSIDQSDEAGRIWGYVNTGTEPHTIRPVRARRLRFFVGGFSKTRPGSIVAGPGTPATTGPIFSQEVHHPGFPGRHFDEQIAEKNDLLVTELMDAALARLAR